MSVVNNPKTQRLAQLASVLISSTDSLANAKALFAEELVRILNEYDEMDKALKAKQ